MGNDSINISSNGGPTQCGRLSTAAPSQIKVWAGVAAGALLAAVVTATVALTIPAAGAICLAAAAVPAVAALILAILAGIRLCQKSENPDKNDESLLTTATESQDPDKNDEIPLATTTESQGPDANSHDYESLLTAVTEKVENSHAPITLDRGTLGGLEVDAAMLITLLGQFKEAIGLINLSDLGIEVNGDDLVRLFGYNHNLEIRLTDYTEAKNAIGYDVKSTQITHKRNIDINGDYYAQQFKFNVGRCGRITCNVMEEQIAGAIPDPMAGRPEGLSDDAWYKVRDGGLLAAEDGSIAPLYHYFYQLAPQDLPIILKHWGHKFKCIPLDCYPHTLPPLDFSRCVNATHLSLKYTDTLPELSGLAQCKKLISFSFCNSNNINPQFLNALPDKVTIYCFDSSLFRKNSQRKGEIDTDQLLQFLKGHPGATVDGLISSGYSDPPKEIQNLLSRGVLKIVNRWKTGIQLAGPDTKDEQGAAARDD